MLKISGNTHIYFCIVYLSKLPQSPPHKPFLYTSKKQHYFSCSLLIFTIYSVAGKKFITL